MELPKPLSDLGPTGRALRSVLDGRDTLHPLLLLVRAEPIDGELVSDMMSETRTLLRFV